MDHPRWQEVELSCRTSTFNRLHHSPAWSQGLSRNQPGRDTALPGPACLALCSALLHLPAWSTERHLFIQTPEEAACAAALAGKPSAGGFSALHCSPLPCLSSSPVGLGCAGNHHGCPSAPFPCTAPGALQQHPCRAQGRQHGADGLRAFQEKAGMLFACRRWPTAPFPH